MGSASAGGDRCFVERVENHLHHSGVVRCVFDPLDGSWRAVADDSFGDAILVAHEPELGAFRGRSKDERSGGDRTARDVSSDNNSARPDVDIPPPGGLRVRRILAARHDGDGTPRSPCDQRILNVSVDFYEVATSRHGRFGPAFSGRVRRSVATASGRTMTFGSP